VVTGTEVLDADRGEHVVLFHRDGPEFAARVGEYLLPAIRDGGTAIVIATPGHRACFEGYLAEAGMDVAAARARGSYLGLDASETMRGFMAADWPDPARFWQVMSPLLAPAAGTGRPVRVFGEMVALLWETGLASAAIELEAMWNELGAQYPFSLLCGYPAESACCAHHLDALTEIRRLHAGAIGT
jgi:hypothetical protein